MSPQHLYFWRCHFWWRYIFGDKGSFDCHQWRYGEIFRPSPMNCFLVVSYRDYGGTEAMVVVVGTSCSSVKTTYGSSLLGWVFLGGSIYKTRIPKVTLSRLNIVITRVENIPSGGNKKGIWPNGWCLGRTPLEAPTESGVVGFFWVSCWEDVTDYFLATQDIWNM